LPTPLATPLNKRRGRNETEREKEKEKQKDVKTGVLGLIKQFDKSKPTTKPFP